MQHDVTLTHVKVFKVTHEAVTVTVPKKFAISLTDSQPDHEL